MKHLFFILLAITTSLSATCYAGELVLKFEHEVTVSVPTETGQNDPRKYAANEEIKLTSDKVYWLEAKGKVPTMIVPNSYSKKEPMKVNLVDVTHWPSSTMQKVIDNKMSTMMDLMTQFQAQLTRKNVKGAEETLNRMASVEDISSLDVFRAYLAYMRGDVETAKSTVKRALASHPENVQGQELLKTLEGGRKQ